MKTSKRLQGVLPSATLAITAYANEMRASGIDVIDLAAGEPDFESPNESKKDAIAAIEEGFTKYTAASGISSLKDTIAEKLLRENRLEYTKEEIIISCGAKHALFNLMQALLDPGDEVLIPSPYWLSYPDQVRLNGATPVFIPTNIPAKKTVKKKKGPDPYSKEYMKQKWGTSIQSYALDKGLSKKIKKIPVRQKVQKQKSIIKSVKKPGFGFFNYIIPLAFI